MTVRLMGLPTPPVEVADEVELWARESGRHGTLHFVPTRLVGRRVVEGTWLVRLSLRDNDKRMQAYQQGLAAEPPTEDVWLHEPDPVSPTGYRPYTLGDLGASGVRQFLEKGNTWSGRGQFGSKTLEGLAREAIDKNRNAGQVARTAAREECRLKLRDERRWRLKIPFLNVGISIPRAAAAASNDPVTAATSQEKTL
mgnify:CR=1 FL=1